MCKLFTNRCSSQGKYAEAGPLYERFQAISEKVLGADHLEVAAVLNNRAMLLEKEVTSVWMDFHEDRSENVHSRAIRVSIGNARRKVTISGDANTGQCVPLLSGL